MTAPFTVVAGVVHLTGNDQRTPCGCRARHARPVNLPPRDAERCRACFCH